jgi:hypothetical protein
VQLLQIVMKRNGQRLAHAVLVYRKGECFFFFDPEQPDEFARLGNSHRTDALSLAGRVADHQRYSCRVVTARLLPIDADLFAPDNSPRAPFEIASAR